MLTNTSVTGAAGVLDRLQQSQSPERRARNELIRQIEQAYVPNERDDKFQVALDEVVDAHVRHFEARLDGAHRNVGSLAEGRLLAVVGHSGAGKTRLLERHFHHRPEFRGYGTSNCLLISVKAQGPFALSGLARSIAVAAGVKVRKAFHNRDAAFQFARDQVEDRIIIIHIDEAQLLLSSPKEEEIQSARNLLRTFCQESKWPVSVILSGTPETSKLFGDYQIARRQTIITLDEIDFQSGVPILQSAMNDFLKKASLAEALDRGLLFEQLMYASLYQLGDSIAIMRAAFSHAIRENSGTLKVEHFAAAFHDRTSCPADLNVFGDEVDYRTIDVAKLYEQARGKRARKTSDTVMEAMPASTAAVQPTDPVGVRKLRVKRKK
ncbi:MAG: ATP-binding protein [Pelagibacterium sp.]|uniref:ATP-binding protein n=1 Tax=Pelagibacterium sp. TaxID=1967288 RepID=UPI0032F03853